VWRHYDTNGHMAGDRITLESTSSSVAATGAGAEPLLNCVMRDGRRLRASPSLDEIRARAKRELERLPEPLRRLEPDATYPVEIGADLVELAALVDSRIGRS
jgi:nicotinate phosphoribosyltransferase